MWEAIIALANGLVQILVGTNDDAFLEFVPVPLEHTSLYDCIYQELRPCTFFNACMYTAASPLQKGCTCMLEVH